MNDTYHIIKKAAVSAIKIQTSRFIGYVAHASSENEAEAYIQQIRRKHYDATHNCTAWRIGLGADSRFRYNDDGEPSGTAGKPILEAIDGHDVTRVVCVVTRYYGGTKLGTGGLARAYRQSAAEGLKRAGKTIRYITQDFKVRFPYDLTGQVMSFISNNNFKIVDTRYDEETTLIARIRLSQAGYFEKELVEHTAGKIQLIPVEETRL